LASLAFCVWMTPRNPELAFFLPFTRFWELLLGALLALGEPAVVGRLAAIHRTALRVGGSLLIAVSFVAMTDATAFPGWAALIPCLGAALFILGGSGAGVSQFVAPGAKVLRWVGLISYPSTCTTTSFSPSSSAGRIQSHGLYRLWQPWGCRWCWRGRPTGGLSVR